MILKHFSHPHLMHLTIVNFDSTDKRHACGMCDCFIEGTQMIYYCQQDMYVIHKKCSVPQHMNHPLHPRHRLSVTITAHKKDSSSRTVALGPTGACACYYCDKLILLQNEPLYYKCDHCSDVHMHVTCALTPLPVITTPTIPGGAVQYVCHEKPMVLVRPDTYKPVPSTAQGKDLYFLGQEGPEILNRSFVSKFLGPTRELVEAAEQKGGEKCFACRSVIIWSGLDHEDVYYSCAVEKTCKNFLHKTCVEKLPPRIQSHPFHPQHALTLQVSKPPRCDLCCTKDCMVAFACVEDRVCSVNLCTKCAFLEKNITCRSHDHSLFLVESFAMENAGGVRCDACQKEYEKCDEVDATQTYLFRCMECHLNYHFLCGPLPISLKYEYHIHSLALVDHSVTKDDSDEYYCDVCEQKRDPQCRLYYCSSCKFNAHIHCLLQEILKVIKGGTKNVELCVLGENRWSFEGINNAEIKELTLRDIMDSLTEQEKESLKNPFHLTDSEKSIQIIRHNFHSEQNSRRERESGVEDIDWVQQLFKNYSFRDYHDLLQEILCYKNSQSLKVSDMYLRQKVVDVGGYMVPKTLAPILKTLLAKHGNIGGKTNLTSGMKSVAATILCAAIERMCRANFEDISKKDLKEWYLELDGAINVAGFKTTIVDYKSLKISIIGALPGLQAIRCYKDVRDKLRYKKMILQAELRRCEENMKKLETYLQDSEISDFMGNSLSIAVTKKGMKVGDLCLSI